MHKYPWRKMRWFVAGAAVVAVAAPAAAFASSSGLPTFTLTSGGSGTVACPNDQQLSNSSVDQSSETVSCSDGGSTTTTTTDPSSTTTQPTTTTTLPPTTTTTISTPASGGNCANPSFSSSEATGTDNIDPGDGGFWWVDNDAWSGSHGPQTINVCNQSSWYATSNQPNVQGQVETYPNTEYDIGGRNNGVPTRPISGYPAGSITSTFSEVYPSGGGWDASYDLWTDTWENETMVWNQWAGDNAFWPSQAKTPVTIDGVGYTFLANGHNCSAAVESTCEYMFFRDTQVTSGSVDLAAILQWEVANGYAKASDVPTQLEYGVEISYTNGPETFPMTGLTFSVS